jgi:hypothetical protein
VAGWPSHLQPAARREPPRSLAGRRLQVPGTPSPLAESRSLLQPDAGCQPLAKAPSSGGPSRKFELGRTARYIYKSSPIFRSNYVRIPYQYC